MPPKIKDSTYPTGDDRKMAEACCRHWDRLDQFRPTAAVVTLDVKAIQKEVTPLPLMVLDHQKAMDFVRAGKRVLICLGGKATRCFTRGLENVTKTRGSYLCFNNSSVWYKNIVGRLNNAVQIHRSGQGKKAGLLPGASGAHPANALEALFDVAPSVLERSWPNGGKKKGRKGKASTVPGKTGG